MNLAEQKSEVCKIFVLYPTRLTKQLKMLHLTRKVSLFEVMQCVCDIIGAFAFQSFRHMHRYRHCLLQFHEHQKKAQKVGGDRKHRLWWGWEREVPAESQKPQPGCFCRLLLFPWLPSYVRIEKFCLALVQLLFSLQWCLFFNLFPSLCPRLCYSVYTNGLIGVYSLTFSHRSVQGSVIPCIPMG